MLHQMCLAYSPRLVCILILSFFLTFSSNLLHINAIFVNNNGLLSERKDKIEDGNRILIQKFQSQLTQQLELLHKAVAASVTQQEQQLKDMEEDMQSFVSTKAEVIIHVIYFHNFKRFQV